MDVRQYYKKLHELEVTLPEADAVVVSYETPDGGKAGVMTEVARRNACQLLLERRARLASDAEAEEFRRNEAAKRKEFELNRTAGRIQVQVVATELTQPAPARTGN
jgi:hypothetical protein